MHTLWCKTQAYMTKKKRGKASSSVPTWLLRPLRTRMVGGVGSRRLEAAVYPISPHFRPNCVQTHNSPLLLRNQARYKTDVPLLGERRTLGGDFHTRAG
jgi:hypothetical protein